MSVLGRLLVAPAQRLDLPDFLAIDSYGAGDWKYFLKGFVGENNPYILKGFEVIDPGQSIGSTGIAIKVADSIVFYPNSSAGAFFHGLKEGDTLAQPLIPELKKNTKNYVYLTLDTVDTAKDTRSFWDQDKEGGTGGEFTQDVNTESVIVANVNVSISSFPQNTIPICEVVVGSDFIESVEDKREMFFRLGSGGMSSSPYNRYGFKELPSSDYARSEPSSKITNPLNPNPFQGGDKNIASFKEWMDAVMTKLAELGGTTYWYEDTQAYNMINMFNDSLANSIKSKGQWQHSDTTVGKIIWTEDIVSQSLQDKRDYIIRSGDKTLSNDEIMYVVLQRNLPPNDFNYSLTWFNNINHVNGPIGSFANLSKGDWIKKTDDVSSKYLRVEEFYLLDNKGGGITTPSNAQSIKLSGLYTGTSSIIEGTYCKGVYSNSDISIDNRLSNNMLSAGGDLFWLAFRSDTIMSISGIAATTLTLNITEQSGEKAKVTCTFNSQTGNALHLLEDGERITISGSVSYNGTYKIEKETDEIFYINTTATGDETVSGYYGTVTTTSRYSADGLLLESSNHNFKSDQQIIISDTASGWNNTYEIFVKNDTKFSIPVPGNIISVSTGLATLPKINVRTEVSQAKITQGEVKYVGDVDSQNIQTYIGMKSLAQETPEYYTSDNYNTKRGSSNYNCDLSEDLTTRVAKLTSMMADKAQDKTIKFAPDYSICVKTTNGVDQDIEFFRDGGSPKLSIILNSSASNNIINLSGTLSLAVNKVAYFNIDRNNSLTLASLSDLTVSNIGDLPLSENVFVFAYRLNDTSVWLWDQIKLTEGNNTVSSDINDMLNDNVYDENVFVISGSPSSLNEIQGPVAPLTYIPLPLDSRNTNQVQNYIVGKGVLEVFLNGISLKNGIDWQEVGTIGTPSNSIRIDIDLVIGDELQFRIDAVGGYIISSVSGGGGSGETNYGVNVGGYSQVYKQKQLEALEFRTIKGGDGVVVTQNANYIEIKTSNQLVTVTSNYTALLTDNIILADASSGDLTINLLQASLCAGKRIDVKKLDSTLNYVIIDAYTSELIDGALQQTTNQQYESFTLVCDGTSWYLI